MKNEKGMTLIELLATIAIFSMIIGVSYSLFSFVQANWMLTHTYVRSETNIQELEMALTRETAAPTSITRTDHGVKLTNYDESIRSIIIQEGKIRLYSFDEHGKNPMLLHDFAIPIERFELLDTNKNPVPVGAGLTDGIAYFFITYTTEGVMTKQRQLTIPVELFTP